MCQVNAHTGWDFQRVQDDEEPYCLTEKQCVSCKPSKPLNSMMSTDLQNAMLQITVVHRGTGEPDQHYLQEHREQCCPQEHRGADLGCNPTAPWLPDAQA